MGGTREIGLMGSMMGMGLRAGLGEAGTGGNIVKVFDMVMGFIGSIQGIVMQGSGIMGRATVLECRLALMGVVMLGNLSVGLSMGLVATILGEFLIFD